MKFIKNFITKRYIVKAMTPQETARNLYNINDPSALQVARECLLTGDVIALPTDTVYGLACFANNEKAVQNLYEIKGREFHKPVAIYVKDLNDFRRYGKSEHLSNKLLEMLLPGPLTIIVERSKHLNNRFLNPSTNLVGIRNTDCSFIQNLSAMCDGQPLALTSANRSHQPSSLNAFEFCELWPKLGGVFDAGQIGLTQEQRAGSTVVDLSEPGYYKIVREGIAFQKTLDLLQKFNIVAAES